MEGEGLVVDKVDTPWELGLLGELATEAEPATEAERASVERATVELAMVVLTVQVLLLVVESDLVRTAQHAASVAEAGAQAMEPCPTLAVDRVSTFRRPPTSIVGLEETLMW